MVMPAVASLAAARDARGLERIKYDGPRLHVGLLLPVALLAWIYAGPFLSLWVGDRLGYDAARVAPLMRLFLVATIPLVLSVPVQMAIGMGRLKVVALSALAGSLVNLPISYVLTTRLGVSGVIWGTVLTTLFSNLLVPGIHVFRVLEIKPATFLARSLGAPLAGAAALAAATCACHALIPLAPGASAAPARSLPLLAHLSVGSLAYVAGYLAVATGRADLAALARALSTSGPRARGRLRSMPVDHSCLPGVPSRGVGHAGTGADRASGPVGGVPSQRPWRNIRHPCFFRFFRPDFPCIMGM